jgi:hypothetical protein
MFIELAHRTLKVEVKRKSDIINGLIAEKNMYQVPIQSSLSIKSIKSPFLLKSFQVTKRPSSGHTWSVQEQSYVSRNGL